MRAVKIFKRHLKAQAVNLYALFEMFVFGLTGRVPLKSAFEAQHHGARKREANERREAATTRAVEATRAATDEFSLVPWAH